MKTTSLHQLAFAVVLSLGMTLVPALVTTLGGETSVVFAEDQPDSSTIISPQTIGHAVDTTGLVIAAFPGRG
jgi:hypothetical protein